MKSIIQTYYSRIKNRLKITEFSKKLTVVNTFFLKAGISIGIGIVLFIIASGLFDKSYIIQPFNVPASFQEQGYHGAVVSNAVLDKMNELINISIYKDEIDNEKIKEQEILDGMDYKTLEGAFEMEVSGVGINLNNIVGALKQATGVNKKSITGELTKIDSSLFLNIRISGFPAIRLEEKINENNGIQKAYDNIIKSAAEFILKNVKPLRYLYYTYEIKRYDEAKRIANNLIQYESENRKFAYNILGLIAQHKKDYNLALTLYNKAIAEDVDFSIAYNNWGICLVHMKRYDDAIKGYENAHILKPKNSSVLHNWGLCLAKQKKYKEAIEKYKAAIEIDSFKTKYYHSWGVALKELKDFEEARKKYLKCIDLEVNNPKTYNNIAVLYQTMGNLDSSIFYANKSLSCDSTYCFAYSTIAENYSIKNNDSLFYHSLKLALKNGYPEEYFRKNNYYRKYYKEQELKNLVAQYQIQLE